MERDEVGTVFTSQVNEHIVLSQRRGGLTFGTDAYLLSAYVRPQPKAVAVDLGSGTGIIPMLCLSRNKARSFVGVELQTDFCDVIRDNAQANGFTDRLVPLHKDVRELQPSDIAEKVSLVTANPPYMKAGSGAGNESAEKYIARHETAGTVADFCAAAGRILQDGGRFVCVFRPERTVELLCAMREAQLEPKRMTAVQATPLAQPSIILVEAIKSSAAGLFLTPPLCLWKADAENPHKPDRQMIPTEDSEFIYANCAFPKHFINR